MMLVLVLLVKLLIIAVLIEASTICIIGVIGICALGLYILYSMCK